MKSVEIYFSDLNDEAQKEVLKAAGVESPSDMNWEYCPLTILDFEEVEDN